MSKVAQGGEEWLHSVINYAPIENRYIAVRVRRVLAAFAALNS